MTRAPLASLAVWLAAVCGCGSDGAAPDLSTARDLQAPATELTLTLDGVARPLAAYYSIFVEPLEMPGVPIGIELVVTFIEPAFQCAGSASGLDALSFGFQARLAGVTSTSVLGRSGPHLGPLGSGSGYAELDEVDDRYLDFDGGAVIVAPGGKVRGRVHFAAGTIVVDGPFVASHCARLDVAASP